MDSLTKRNLIFILGCMGTRLFLVWLAYRFISLQPTMGILASFSSLGYFTIYVMGWRKTGVEVMCDKIWWDAVRPVHGFLCALFAFLGLQTNPHAWLVLLVDTVIGGIAFASNRISRITGGFPSSWTLMRLW